MAHKPSMFMVYCCTIIDSSSHHSPHLLRSFVPLLSRRHLETNENHDGLRVIHIQLHVQYPTYVPASSRHKTLYLTPLSIPADSSNNNAALTARAIVRHNINQLHTVARPTPEFNQWHSVKVLYHYMRLRAHQCIPETQKLLELLYKYPLSSLPESIRQGHEGRLVFLKRAWEDSMRALKENRTVHTKGIDQEWVMVDDDTIDGEKWDELGK